MFEIFSIWSCSTINYFKNRPFLDLGFSKKNTSNKHILVYS